jgi:hypothetical protein
MGNTRQQSGNRPLMQAMASQQALISKLQERNASLAHENAVLGLQMAYVARLAGVTKEVAAIRTQADLARTADADNPAQPVPNPPSEQATESTEQAVTPEAYDNPNQIGETPGANRGVAAETTATPMDPGVTLPTAPYNNLVNVSAPVSGTETHVPDEMTRIETDIRVGDPMNPETAFPLNPAFGPSQQQGTTPPRDGEMAQTASRRVAAISEGRTMASIRLARLRVQAGTARGDDLEVAAAISADTSLTDAMIRHEIATLSQVNKAAARAQRPQGLVPRAARSQQVQRTMPSLVAQAPITSVAGAVGATDEDAESLFD